MKNIKDYVIEILKKENSGILPDEADREASAILYGTNYYELAKRKMWADMRNDIVEENQKEENNE